MRKTIILLITVILVTTSGLTAVSVKGDTTARAAVIMDVKTGRILYSKNMNEKLPMASTTKIMTTLVTVESGKLNEIVKVSRKASIVGGSSIYLKEGEKHSVEDLLYGVMLRSGNDAAYAVAEHVGGSVENFVEMMNRKATEIGAMNTHFANPHGLDAAGHYTTAHDLALITSYALRNPEFAKIVSTKKKKIEGPPNENWDRMLVNKNKMLWQFEGGDGVKTGYTGKAGRCLVSSATRNGMQLVSVVLNCGPMWSDSAVLLEYGFKNYSYEKLVDRNEVYKVVEVKNGKEKLVPIKPTEDFSMPLKQEEKDKVKILTNLSSNVEAPLRKGDQAGKLEVYLDNKLVKAVPLQFNDSIESSSPIYYFKKIMLDFVTEKDWN
ncbi:MAG: serine hydrolase [Caulobacteraceae bacterium]